MGEVDESTKESLQLVVVRTGAWIRSVVDVPPIYPHPTVQLGHAYSKVDFRDSI